MIQVNKNPVKENPYDMVKPFQDQSIVDDTPRWRKICPEFGKGPGDIGYDPGDRNCLVCHLSLVCMAVQKMNNLDTLVEVVRFDHFEGKPFYDENKVKEKGRELVDTYVYTIKVKEEEGDVITTDRLRKALRRDVEEVLNSIDFDLVDVLLEAISNSSNIINKGNEWRYKHTDETN